MHCPVHPKTKEKNLWFSPGEKKRLSITGKPLNRSEGKQEKGILAATLVGEKGGGCQAIHQNRKKGKKIPGHVPFPIKPEEKKRKKKV